jgi:hypothetical protein
MITVNGISNLIAARETLPKTGWLFIEKNFDKVSPSHIAKKNFFIAENDDEEIDAEKKFNTWLEIPTFFDVLITALEENPEATPDDVIDAAIYYLENDTFM